MLPSLSKSRIISGLVGAAAIAAALWAYAHRAPSVARDVPVTPIIDGAAIDFSSGKPVVSTSAADKASMDAAVKQIDDAAKGVTFKADPPPKN
jgi:hypothetical protein